MKRTALALLMGVSLLASAAVAQDAYYDVPIAELTLTEGKLPTGLLPWWGFRAFEGPRAALDVPGEAFVHGTSPAEVPLARTGPVEISLAVRAAAGQEVTGYLFLPGRQGQGTSRLAFRIGPEQATEGAHERFLSAREAHYRHLAEQGLPGAAWFRHQARQPREVTGERATAAPAFPGPRRRIRTGELEDTYAIFTGGRAVSENLQLDRLLEPAGTGAESVDILSLPGITVQEMDWAPLNEGLAPETDPLAELLPADQHALFFRSFGAFLALLDEARTHGTPVLRLLDVRSEDARTHERYERQLGLSTDALSRLLGPQVIRSVALSGSDPFLRTGSDLAILFEAVDTAALRALIDARLTVALQGNPGARELKGEIDGIPYAGARSEDRALCSYVSTLGGAVVVTNSPEQLRRLVAVWNGKEPSLASLPEYTFFRDRYARGDAAETALLLVPDAAIRRWCGPVWRIGASRRTRAAAFMADLQARFLDKLVSGEAEPDVIDEVLPLPDAGELRLTADGV
ncbi:MAG: hypothetical protein ACYS8K_05835, partial [Planctomycetota bacterium]